MKDKIEKFFKTPAIYMQPHKNALEEIEKRKGYFKPKVMLGSLRKPIREFTSDLQYLQHTSSKLIKKQKKDSRCIESISLKQKHISTRKHDKLLKKAQAI